MIKILHTLLEVANAGLADAVRKEAEKVLSILSEAYGNADVLLRNLMMASLWNESPVIFSVIVKVVRIAPQTVLN